MRAPSGFTPRSGLYQLRVKSGGTQKVFAYDLPGTVSRSWRNPGLRWSDSDTVEVKFVRVGPNQAASGAPAITGTALVGNELTADVGRIADGNGLPAASGFSYRWFRVDSAQEVEIEGATANTYTLGPADWQKQVKVEVSFTDGEAYEEVLTSAAFPAGTATVGAAARSPSEPAHCDSGNPNEVWCTVMTVGTNSNAHETTGLRKTYGGVGSNRLHLGQVRRYRWLALAYNICKPGGPWTSTSPALIRQLAERGARPRPVPARARRRGGPEDLPVRGPDRGAER